MLIYKEIGRKSTYPIKKKDISSCEIECSIQPAFTNIRKKSLRASTKQSDDEDNGKAIASKTLCIKNKPKSSYNTPSKLEMYNAQGQSQQKKLQILKDKFLTEAKDH